MLFEIRVIVRALVHTNGLFSVGGSSSREYLVHFAEQIAIDKSYVADQLLSTTLITILVKYELVVGTA